MKPLNRLSRFPLAAVTLAITMIPVVPGSARAGVAEDTCVAAVAKSGVKYFRSFLKSVNGCETARASGKLAETVNCRPSVGAVTDIKTAASLAKATETLSAALQSACAGVVDFPALPVAAPCASPANVTALATCLASDGFGADAERLVRTVFGDMGFLDGATVKMKCEKSTATALSKLAAARVKAKNKCLASLADGDIPGPCPDAATVATMDAARAKAEALLFKVCPENVLTGLSGMQPGFPCDLFLDSAFLRRPGTNNNRYTAAMRYTRCMLATGAGVGDMVFDRASAQSPEPTAFPSGVAAGDPTSSAVVVWTRTAAPGNVSLEVATDAAFSNIVHTGSLTPDAAADNAVHAEVSGLSSATTYHYRFSQGAERSRTGQVRTLDASPLLDTLNFSFTGDSNAAFKPFSVLDQITGFQPEFWLYIGDTIYGDDARSGTGVATTRPDYHGKYSENRADRGLRDLLANVGVFTMWDDHEVTNDFWGNDPSTQVQMEAGNQAFRDYFPLREDGGDPQKLYRSFKVGELAEFFLIDDRQYRDAQADLTEPACITGSCSATADSCAVNADCDAFGPAQTCHKGTCSLSGDPCSTVGDCGVGEACEPLGGDTLPNATCAAEMARPGRSYLGAAQMAWLKDGLANSTATYKFVANGPILTSLLFVPYDRWEGYAAERSDLLGHIASNAISNVVFLSTDIHAAILNTNVDSGSVIEAVAGAVGMDPILRELPASVSSLVSALPSLFPTAVYWDIDRFNVCNVTVTHDDLTFTWRDGSGQVLQQQTFPAQP